MEKGYVVGTGYMGYVSIINEYMLFATEDEYREYIDSMVETD